MKEEKKEILPMKILQTQLKESMKKSKVIKMIADAEKDSSKVFEICETAFGTEKTNELIELYPEFDDLVGFLSQLIASIASGILPAQPQVKSQEDISPKITE